MTEIFHHKNVHEGLLCNHSDSGTGNIVELLDAVVDNINVVISYTQKPLYTASSLKIYTHL